MKPEQRMPDADNPGPAPTESSNVDKIRDILFGNQMRDYEGKFARLEDRLGKNANELRDDVDRQLKSLEAFVKGELSALVDQLRTEKEERVQSATELAGSVAELGRGEEKRLSKFEAQNDKAHRELREQILSEANRLGDKIRKETSELAAALNRESKDMRGSLAHRQDLAELFAQLALKLRGDEAEKPKK